MRDNNIVAKWRCPISTDMKNEIKRKWVDSKEWLQIQIKQNKIKLKYSILESNYPKPQKNWTNTLQKILINKRFIVLLISCWLKSFKFHWQKPKIDQEIKRRLQCFNEKCGCISQWCHLLKNPSKEGFLSIVFNSYSITYIYV